jgi:glutathione S-transferase
MYCTRFVHARPIRRHRTRAARRGGRAHLGGASARPATGADMNPTEETTLTISSLNYSSWSMRGWLMAKLSGLPFTTRRVPIDDAARAELLLLSPSILVPCLRHDGLEVWDTLAIGEYLNEVCPTAQLLPAGRRERAHCRAISGEMHSGFSALRAALPMNLRASCPGFRIWSRAQQDIERIVTIWRDCLARYGGPWLFGARISLADAMYAPVVTRFLTYDVKLDPDIADYCMRVLAHPFVVEWIDGAQAEDDGIDALDMEF